MAFHIELKIRKRKQGMMVERVIKVQQILIVFMSTNYALHVTRKRHTRKIAGTTRRLTK